MISQSKGGCRSQEKLSKRRFLSQLENPDRDIIIERQHSKRQAENVVVKEDAVDHELTADNSCSNLPSNKTLVYVKTLEKCFKERIDEEMGNMLDTVKDGIQNAISTEIDSAITSKLELTVRSIRSSSGRDAADNMANSERGEHTGVTARSESVSERTSKLHVLNTNDETRNSFPDKVIELSVPGAHFHRQPDITYHMVTRRTAQAKHITAILIGHILTCATHHHNNIRTCQHK